MTDSIRAVVALFDAVFAPEIVKLADCDCCLRKVPAGTLRKTDAGAQGEALACEQCRGIEEELT